MSNSKKEPKRKQILLFVDHGQVWSVAKVNNGFNPIILVQNNDTQSLKVLQVQHDCDAEVEEAFSLANAMAENLVRIEHKVRKVKKLKAG